MSKKANPTTIGTFVIGAVFLAIAGVITFGKSELFAKEDTYVCFFDSSLAGLDVGAPVRFQGIQVGTVKMMEGIVDPDTLEIDIPVYIAMRRGAMRLTRELTDAEEEDRGVFMQRLIEKGLRASLRKDSLVTGKLYVAFEFSADTPLRLIGHEEYPEIPTTEGALAEFTKNLEEIDFDGLVDGATEAAEAIKRLVENPEIGELVHNLNELVKNLDAEIEPLSSSSQSVMGNADSLLTNANTELEQLSDAIQSTLAELEGAGKDYALIHKATVVLEEFAATARSIRILADYLERHPEALIKGKN
jgi:paraquat-inducible protein B